MTSEPAIRSPICSVRRYSRSTVVNELGATVLAMTRARPSKGNRPFVVVYARHPDPVATFRDWAHAIAPEAACALDTAETRRAR